MRREILLNLLTVLFVITAFSANAQHDEGHTTEKKDTVELSQKEIEKKERQEYIQHHLQDSYDFNLFSFKKEDGTKKHVGFPLPVILWDNGLQVFSSSKFHHGETVAEHNGNFYKLYHNKVYKTDAAGTINYDAEHHPNQYKTI